MFQFRKLNITILHHYLLVFMLYVERSSWSSFKCQCTFWQTLTLCVPLKCSSPKSFNWWRKTLISIFIHIFIHLCRCHLCCSLPKTLDFLTFIFLLFTYFRCTQNIRQPIQQLKMNQYTMNQFHFLIILNSLYWTCLVCFKRLQTFDTRIVFKNLFLEPNMAINQICNINILSTFYIFSYSLKVKYRNLVMFLFVLFHFGQLKCPKTFHFWIFEI
jgi:hypothetical protein